MATILCEVFPDFTNLLLLPIMVMVFRWIVCRVEYLSAWAWAENAAWLCHWVFLGSSTLLRLHVLQPFGQGQSLPKRCNCESSHMQQAFTWAGFLAAPLILAGPKWAFKNSTSTWGFSWQIAKARAWWGRCEASRAVHGCSAQRPPRRRLRVAPTASTWCLFLHLHQSTRPSLHMPIPTLPFLPWP